jgi:GT2 family glycosyltransferase
MESNQNMVIAQPKIKSYREKEKFEYAGAAGGFIDFLGYPFCQGRLFNQLETDKGQYNEVKEVFWASGACMFIKSSVFKSLGGFDASYFAHMEEIDFCWRIKQKGYKVMYTPQSTVYHVGGGTLPAASSYKVYLNIRNNLSMLYKNLPQKSLKRILLIRLFLDGIAALKFFAGGGFRDLLAVVRAHKHFFKMIPRLKKKRRALLPGKVTKVYCGNMVAAHYLFRKKTFKALSPKRFT